MAERPTELGIPDVTARFELHAGETHMSVLQVAVNRAVQWAFGRAEPKSTS